MTFVVPGFVEINSNVNQYDWIVKSVSETGSKICVICYVMIQAP